MIGSGVKYTIKQTMKHVLDEDVATPPVQSSFLILMDGGYVELLSGGFLKLTGD